MTDAAPLRAEGDVAAYVLGVLRCAALRARLAVNEIQFISTALRGGLISPEAAIEWYANLEHEIDLALHLATDSDREPTEHLVSEGA
jgi:hypothetical protein